MTLNNPQILPDYTYNKLNLKQIENWLRNGRKLTVPYTAMEESMMQLRDALYIIENIGAHIKGHRPHVNLDLILRTTDGFLNDSKVQPPEEK